jgi:hypothetical protein
MRPCPEDHKSTVRRASGWTPVRRRAVALRALRRVGLQFVPGFARFIASRWPGGDALPTVRTSTTRVVRADRTFAMLKNAETVFFLLATLAALALPAVPAVQEALTADYATVEAALPTWIMERVVIVAPDVDPPQQVATVR